MKDDYYVIVDNPIIKKYDFDLTITVDKTKDEINNIIYICHPYILLDNDLKYRISNDYVLKYNKWDKQSEEDCISKYKSDYDYSIGKSIDNVYDVENYHCYDDFACTCTNCKLNFVGYKTHTDNDINCKNQYYATELWIVIFVMCVFSLIILIVNILYFKGVL